MIKLDFTVQTCTSVYGDKKNVNRDLFSSNLVEFSEYFSKSSFSTVVCSKAQLKFHQNVVSFKKGVHLQYLTDKWKVWYQPFRLSFVPAVYNSLVMPFHTPWKPNLDVCAFFRSCICPSFPTGTPSKGWAFQIAEDACDWSPKTGKVSPSGGFTDRPGVPLHSNRMQHLHLCLGAG